ncbi:uncharacterized protein ACMZJ9_014135 [Mantella aurantiaca]
MTKSIRMEADWSHMTERILNLTLEIIYLLTGESFPPAKSGDYLTIRIPPPQILKSTRDNDQKILEVTQKMVGLLTRESGNLSGSKANVKKEIKEESHESDVLEESELPKHKNLYQDTIVKSSNYRNPPEKYLHPQNSWDSTQKGHNYRKYYQNGNLRDYNIVIKEEYIEEDEKYTVMEEFSAGYKDLYKDIVMEPPSKRNPPDRCPRPLYSWDSTQEDLTIPHHHQVGGVEGT